jgi:hypothetical protein
LLVSVSLTVGGRPATALVSDDAAFAAAPQSPAETADDTLSSAALIVLD